MGIEYYLVNPEKEEIFYLAKHFYCPEGIIDFKYTQKADYIDYASISSACSAYASLLEVYLLI